MTRLHFSCTLLSDVVLSAKAATEGFHKSLDYIPGAKFLGMVAGKHYPSPTQLAQGQNTQQTLDLFHNGCVRFGDAHPSNANWDLFYKVPATWLTFKAKTEAKSADQTESKSAVKQTQPYRYYQLQNADLKKAQADGLKLKALRSGYFNLHDEMVRLDQNFSIKSAYDSDKRRSRDAQMYGYFALPKGSVWRFWVDTDQAQYVDLLTEALVGKQRLGRSSSAEYGLIEIKSIPAPSAGSATTIQKGTVQLYAQSNWCFYEEGYSTVQPDAVKHLGLPAGSTIKWDQSHVTSRTYLTWNRHRSNRDADRLIIEKGSVIVVELSQPISSSIFDQGIGAHRSEGFGQIWVNPPFLPADPSTGELKVFNRLPDALQPLFQVIEKGEQDDKVLSFLRSKVLMNDVDSLIDTKVNVFVNDYRDKFKGISSSQWGQIRNLSKNLRDETALNEILFAEEDGFCRSGQTQSKWQEAERWKTLQEFIFEKAELQGGNILDLTMKLSSEMAKVAQNQ
ncbi:hypothetical protein [Haliscomenobacter sp.]|uniref:hypothetical protein n=1 Tax=Haliscomenobacter sp. TaxID=2717303 RepID=UPI0035940507